jgi:putative phosphoesterase
MSIAALYDIHGNLPALDAVLADVAAEHVDAVVLGGDMVLGPFPAETLARLRELEHAHWIRGNCDRELGEDHTAFDRDFAEQLSWCATALGGDDVRELAALPFDLVLDVDGLGAVRFCHATPRSDTERVTRATPEAELRKLFAGETADVVVCGHTHIQFDRRVGARRLANAGSVGWPWEDERGAYWALLGPDIRLRRTCYDVEAAVAGISREFPDHGFSASLLAPPGAEETTRRFEEAR